MNNETVQVTCYGVTEKYASLKDAKNFFLEAILNSQGAENERYVNIYTQLEEGYRVCSDEY